MLGEYWWLVYVLFLAIPLARILPRIVARRRGRDDGYGYGAPYRDSERVADSYRTRPGEDIAEEPRETGPVADAPDDAGHVGGPGREHDIRADASKPGAGGQTNEMVVMGAIHRGARTFEAIQKKTGMDDAVLDRTLAVLEGEQMIRVVTKKGLLGERVELHPTDKGFGRYYGR